MVLFRLPLNRGVQAGALPAAALLVGALLVACAKPAQAQFLYGITDGTNGKIYEADIVGQKTTLAFTTNLGYLNGLAFSEAGDGGNGQLFYRAGTSTLNGSGGIYVWNRRTGVQTQITVPASINSGKLFGQSSNASWFGGAYWYVDQGKDTLYKVNINFTNPNAPVVSSINTFTNFDGTSTTNFSFGDISIASDGTMYGSITNNFFKISVASGAPDKTTFNSSSVATGQLQVGFGGDGVTLYGTTAGTSGGDWFIVNKETGVRGTALAFKSRDDLGAVLSYNDISEGSLRSVASVVQPEPASVALLLPIAPLIGWLWRRATGGVLPDAAA